MLGIGQATQPAQPPQTSFRGTLRPLRMAILWATTARISLDWLLGHPPSPIVIAIFVWLALVAVALVLVIPVFVLWPPLRTPGYAVAALWGGTASLAGMLVVEPNGLAALQEGWQVLSAAAAGAAGGLGYVATLIFNESN